MEKIITIQKKLSTQNVRMLTMTAGTFCHRFVLAFLNFLFRCLRRLRVWIYRTYPH